MFTSLTVTSPPLFLHCQESTNKAVIADFFGSSRDDNATAFAAVSFFNGYAGAVGYFTFLRMPRLFMAGTVRAVEYGVRGDEVVRVVLAVEVVE